MVLKLYKNRVLGVFEWLWGFCRNAIFAFLENGSVSSKYWTRQVRYPDSPLATFPFNPISYYKPSHSLKNINFGKIWTTECIGIAAFPVNFIIRWNYARPWVCLPDFCRSRFLDNFQSSVFFFFPNAFLNLYVDFSSSVYFRIW